MTLDEYQKRALSTVLPVTNDLMYRSLGLASEAGEVAGKIKKWIRDYGSNMEKLDKHSLAGELGDVLWYTATLADLLGFSLGDVAQMNVDKLAKRKKQNKLGGAGDNR